MAATNGIESLPEFCRANCTVAQNKELAGVEGIVFGEDCDGPTPRSGPIDAKLVLGENGLVIIDARTEPKVHCNNAVLSRCISSMLEK